METNSKYCKRISEMHETDSVYKLFLKQIYEGVICQICQLLSKLKGIKLMPLLVRKLVVSSPSFTVQGRKTLVNGSGNIRGNLGISEMRTAESTYPLLSRNVRY